MTEVHMVTCRSLAEFKSLVAPLTMSRHMAHFFDQKTNFSSRWNQPAEGYQALYLTSGTQVIALWISEKFYERRISYGTYVERAHRRSGLASLLWAHEKTHAAGIQGSSCTTPGYRFLSALKRKQRNVSFTDCREYR